MRIENQLYFAPNILFADVDFGGPGLPEQFRARMIGFYLNPAHACAQSGHAFAAGALVLLCVDALARLQTGERVVGRRFKTFARHYLASFASESRADCLYDHFRNGLVHEGRIKSGSQFSLDTTETITNINGIMLVNPVLLANEVGIALDRYIDVLHADARVFRGFAAAVGRDHDDDRVTHGVV